MVTKTHFVSSGISDLIKVDQTFVSNKLVEHLCSALRSTHIEQLIS